MIACTQSPKHKNCDSSCGHSNKCAPRSPLAPDTPKTFKRWVASLVSCMSYFLLLSSSGNRHRNMARVVPGGGRGNLFRSSFIHLVRIPSTSGSLFERSGQTLFLDLGFIFDIARQRETKLHRKQWVYLSFGFEAEYHSQRKWDRGIVIHCTSVTYNAHIYMLQGRGGGGIEHECLTWTTSTSWFGQDHLNDAGVGVSTQSHITWQCQPHSSINAI